jgi:hypothetical protein
LSVHTEKRLTAMDYSSRRLSALCMVLDANVVEQISAYHVDLSCGTMFLIPTHLGFQKCPTLSYTSVAIDLARNRILCNFKRLPSGCTYKFLNHKMGG